MNARYVAAASAPTGACEWATIAVRPTPTAWPNSSSASSRGDSEPAARNRSVPSFRSWPVVSPRGGPTVPSRSDAATDRVRQRPEAVRLVGHLQRVDQVVEVAVHDPRQVVDRLPDPVVGHPVLREVVGPDLVRAVTRPDHGPPRSRIRLALLLLLEVVQPGAQHAHRLGLVLVLALLVLDLDHQTGRQVGDTHGGVGRVDALAAGPGRALDVDPQVAFLV